MWILACCCGGWFGAGCRAQLQGLHNHAYESDSIWGFMLQEASAFRLYGSSPYCNNPHLPPVTTPLAKPRRLRIVCSLGFMRGR